MERLTYFRAEFFEQPGLTRNASPSAEEYTQNTSHDKEINGNSSKPQDLRPNWKLVYPDLIPDLVTPMEAPMDIPMEKPFAVDNNARSSTTIEPNNSSSKSLTPDSIQPSKLLLIPIGVINKIPLESVLSTPVGNTSALDRKSDLINPPAVERNPLPSAGKASRHGSVPATDATITEVIRTALVEAKNSSNIGALPMGRKVLPNGKSPPADSWGTTTDDDACLLDDLNKTICTTKDDSPDHEKAIEVLKSLQKLGYVIQKDPNHTPRIQNTGSIASNKSDNQVTCQVCKKFKGRPCELK